MKRFSEDIDLTVEVSDCTTPSQGLKRLRAATKDYSGLRRTADGSREEDRRGSITTVYEYKPVVAVDTRDALQRFGSVKVEATSFTVSDPHEPLEIAPLLFLEATPEEQNLLSTRYGVIPFNIETMKIERIFADKVFAAEFYYQRHDLAQVAKHTYDLVVMMEQAKIKKMMSTPEEFIDMLNYKRREEVVRIGSSLETVAPESLVLYKTGRTNANDGGIDFVMKPFGRFFQVTETIDVNKYFLDIDKVQRFRITFVVKSTETDEQIRSAIQEQAVAKYKIERVVEAYMTAIEEIINVPDLVGMFSELVKSGKVHDVMDEIIVQSRLEFNYDDDDEADSTADEVDSSDS